jgi:hypothetical protein
MWNDATHKGSLDSQTVSFQPTLYYLFGDYTVKIVSVVDGYEQTFWDYVNRDPLNYYFFIIDWNQHMEQKPRRGGEWGFLGLFES